MLKLLIIYTFIISLSACSSNPSKPSPKIQTVQTKLSTTKVKDIIYKMSMKCWNRKTRMNGDGIRVLTTPNGIRVNRYAFDVGSSAPFFIAQISKSSNATISMKEDIWGWTMITSKPIFFNYSSDVKKWLEGSTACYKKEEPVYL